MNLRETQTTQSVLNSIRRIVRALRVSSRSAEKEFGISGAQLYVLQKLGDGAPLSINELADRTLTHQSSASVVVSRLVEKGLVLRAPSESDARRVELRLSARGRAFLAKAPATAQERLISAIESLSSKQRAMLSEFLEAVVLKAGLAEDSPQLFFEDESKEENNK